MIAALALTALLAGSENRGLDSGPTIGQCDPDDGPRLVWSREQRREARARAKAACRALGASRLVCAWVDVAGLRESSWRPSVRHRRGPNEDGLGILGLDKRSHRDKWPGDPEPAWCTPEASVIVALHIARRAITRWDAQNVSDIQAVFAFRTIRTDEGELLVAKDHRADERLCKAMRARGFGCRTPVKLKDVGRWVPVKDRPARTRELAAAATSAGSPPPAPRDARPL